MGPIFCCKRGDIKKGAALASVAVELALVRNTFLHTSESVTLMF